MHARPQPAQKLLLRSAAVIPSWRQQIITFGAINADTISDFTPPTLAGLFFCLASTRCRAFLFARRCISFSQSFTAVFLPSMQLYPTTPKPFTGLYRGFSVDLPHSSAHNTAGAQAAYTPPAPRWRAYRQALHFHRYQTPPPNRDTVQGRAAAYYNKVYIRVRSCYGFMPDSAAYHRPCQPGGVSSYCVWIAGKCCTRRTC